MHELGERSFVCVTSESCKNMQTTYIVDLTVALPRSWLLSCLEIAECSGMCKYH